MSYMKREIENIAGSIGADAEAVTGMLLSGMSETEIRETIRKDRAMSKYFTHRYVKLLEGSLTGAEREWFNLGDWGRLPTEEAWQEILRRLRGIDPADYEDDPVGFEEAQVEAVKWFDKAAEDDSSLEIDLGMIQAEIDATLETLKSGGSVRFMLCGTGFEPREDRDFEEFSMDDLQELYDEGDEIWVLEDVPGGYVAYSFEWDGTPVAQNFFPDWDSLFNDEAAFEA